METKRTYLPVARGVGLPAAMVDGAKSEEILCYSRDEDLAKCYKMMRCVETKEGSFRSEDFFQLPLFQIALALGFAKVSLARLRARRPAFNPTPTRQQRHRTKTKQVRHPRRARSSALPELVHRK